MTTLIPSALGAALQSVDLAVARRLAGIDLTPIQSVADPMTCPRHLLPWLAWHYAVDTWDPSSPIDAQRAAIAASQRIHNSKGTRYAVQQALKAFGVGAVLFEAHQMTPPGAPNTFEVRVTMTNTDVSVATVLDRAISRTKRASSHLTQIKFQFQSSAEINKSSAIVIRRLIKITATGAVVDTSPKYDGTFYYDGSIEHDGVSP